MKEYLSWRERESSVFTDVVVVSFCLLSGSIFVVCILFFLEQGGEKD